MTMKRPFISPSPPPGIRLYAIGDIHGRFDLMTRLLESIKAEADRATVPSKLIFLGDYIDRGLQSRAVMDGLLSLNYDEQEAPVFLLGNHEQVLRDLIETKDRALLQNWLRYGGRETLLSYGMRPQTLSGHVYEADLIEELIALVPDSHHAFLKAMPLCASFGDYFFCHAGVRPFVPLETQKQEDLLWIRHEFLYHPLPFDKIIVHGHTICDAVEFKPNRINLDTGAYATGCLTALGLEGTKQWLLQTR